mmetsp:Transcript_18989/g.25702  ORF Transcript_18989/g.25702 Transcript_18989/m.25702 type:complete len:80 (-) Transcript_18989:97-336(-)
MTPKPSSQLFELRMPRLALEVPQEVSLYILACADSQTIPNTIVGASKPLTQQLLEMVNSGKGFSASHLLRIDFNGVGGG